MIEKNGEIENQTNKIKGSKYDLEYSIDAVQKVSHSEPIILVRKIKR